MNPLAAGLIGFCLGATVMCVWAIWYFTFRGDEEWGEVDQEPSHDWPGKIKPPEDWPRLRPGEKILGYNADPKRPAPPPPPPPPPRSRR
jgi:hypothetical protein